MVGSREGYGSRTGGPRGRTEYRDREGSYDRDSSGRGERTRIFRKKTCRFCTERTDSIDYKDTEFLKRLLTEKGKIMPRRITGTCAHHQRILARALKRSRHSGLLAFQME